MLQPRSLPPPPPPQQQWVQVFAELNHRVFDIISEIRSNDVFVTYEHVVSTLLDRYRVTDLRQLHVVQGSEVAVLHGVFSLQSKLHLYLQAFLSSRPILCLAELESETMQYLQSFQLQSISQIYRRAAPPLATMISRRSDPNEIDLDDDGPGDNNMTTFSEAETDRISCFEDYGLGPLRSHPLVAATFNLLTAGKAPSSLWKTENVMQTLQGYLMDANNQNGFFINEFIPYLLQKHNLRDLQDVGVVLRGDLKETVLSLKHVLRERHRLEADIINAQLTQLKQQHRDIALNQDGKQSERVKVVKAAPVLLEPPPDSLLATFLRTVQEGSMGESLFSPSPAKIEAYLTQCLDANKSSKKDGISVAGKGKRKRDVCDEAAIYAAAAEYAFLQLGSKKQVAKKYEDGKEIPNNQEVEVTSSVQEDKSVAVDEVRVQPTVEELLPNQAADKAVSTPTFEARMAVSNPINDEDISNLIEIVEGVQLESLLPQLAHLPIDHRDLSTVGRYGESLVYHYLQASTGLDTRIEWLNEKEESKACYDLILHTKHRQSFVEVKATRFVDNNVFQISLWEWDFLHKLPKVDYRIYRVFGVGDPLRTKIVVLKDVVKLVELGRVRLCLAV